MKQTIQPKFKVGDMVTHKPDLYGMTESVVTEVGRLFKKIDPHTGGFEMGGLVTEESTIKSICIPYEFDGETLTVHYPEKDYGRFIEKAHTEVSKFYGYCYTTKNEKINTLWSEKSLTLKK